MSKLLCSRSDLRDYLIRRYGELGEAYLVDIPLAATPSVRLSEFYADLIDWSDQRDPLKKIAIPNQLEETVHAHELTDPIGDVSHEAVPGLVHRHRDRVLLLPTTQCRIHCRFCFRRDVIGKRRDFNAQLVAQYLREHPEISEVILSGGDPLTLPWQQLHSILALFDDVKLSHVNRIRIHTRLPVVDPSAVTDRMIALLSSSPKLLTIVFHIDHPREVTPELCAVAKQLRSEGVILLSQSVLLKEINDSTEVLANLFNSIMNAGIKPYYLHHLDLTPGTNHFRLSIAEGLQLYRQLRGQLSGVCIPAYVLDLPGGGGKVAVYSLHYLGDGKYEAKDLRKQTVIYTDPALQE